MLITLVNESSRGDIWLAKVFTFIRYVVLWSPIQPLVYLLFERKKKLFAYIIFKHFLSLVSLATTLCRFCDESRRERTLQNLIYNINMLFIKQSFTLDAQNLLQPLNTTSIKTGWSTKQINENTMPMKILV